MFHLVDGLPFHVAGQLLVAPVFFHLGVNEVLMDRGELRDESFVEPGDDFVVAFHGDVYCRPNA